MEEYIQEIIMEAKCDMDGAAPTPASDHPFHVNTADVNYFNERDAKYLNHMVAKLLFYARDQVQTARQR
jgi:hypothetical protein